MANFNLTHKSNQFNTVSFQVEDRGDNMVYLKIVEREDLMATPSVQYLTTHISTARDMYAELIHQGYVKA